MCALEAKPDWPCLQAPSRRPSVDHLPKPNSGGAGAAATVCAVLLTKPNAFIQNPLAAFLATRPVSAAMPDAKLSLVRTLTTFTAPVVKFAVLRHQKRHSQQPKLKVQGRTRANSTAFVEFQATEA